MAALWPLLNRARSSLRLQLLVVFLLATGLPLAISLGRVQQDRVDAESRASNDAENVADLAAAQVDDLLGDARGVAQTLEQTPVFWSADDFERDRQLAVLAGSRPYFSALVFFTTDLQDHGASNHQASAPRFDLSTRVYASEAVATNQSAFSSEPLVALASNQVIFPVGLPIRNREQSRESGFLAAGLESIDCQKCGRNYHCPRGRR